MEKQKKYRILSEYPAELRTPENDAYISNLMRNDSKGNI